MEKISLNPANDINYKTPLKIYLIRITVVRIIEIWRSISSSLENFFSPGQNRCQKGKCLHYSDVYANTKDLNNVYSDLNQMIYYDTIDEDLPSIEKQQFPLSIF
jgi:hypothetical protein